MNQRFSRSASGILFVFSIFSLGCPKAYRSETVWHADGSVDRSIYQEWGATPEPVRRSTAWQQTTAAPEPQALERSGWTGTISKLPVQKRGAAGPYFAAWGRFRSPEEIPVHYVREAPNSAGIPNSELVRSCRWTDYVFVREYLWREALSDTVEPGQMRAAREQLADLLIDVGRDSINHAFGQEFDATALENWFRTEGKTWLAELVDYAYLHAAAQKGASARQAIANGWAEICAHHGLSLKKEGKFLKNEELERALREFTIQKILQHVRRKDGKPLDKQMVGVFLDELSSPATGTRNTLDQALDQVIAQKYGGKEKLQEQLERLFVRLAGLHVTLAFPGDDFDFVLTVPGEVIETTGQVLSGNRVRWRFAESEAYPLGYAMQCRSLLPILDMQKDLLQNQPLADRETMLAFIALLADREPLRLALEECRRRRSMTPLYEYRDGPLTRRDEKERLAMQRLFELLQLPAQPRTGSRGVNPH